MRVVRAQAARLDAVAKDPDLQLAAAERLERIVIKVVPDVAHVLYMYVCVSCPIKTCICTQRR